MDDDHAAGIYSLDTVMVQLDDEDNATLVGLLHVHDTEANGMVIKHQVRYRLPSPPLDPPTDTSGTLVPQSLLRSLCSSCLALAFSC